MLDMINTVVSAEHLSPLIALVVSKVWLQESVTIIKTDACQSCL